MDRQRCRTPFRLRVIIPVRQVIHYLLGRLPIGVGAVLTQDNNAGQLCAVAYYSKSLAKAQRGSMSTMRNRDNGVATSAGEGKERESKVMQLPDVRYLQDFYGTLGELFHKHQAHR